MNALAPTDIKPTVPYLSPSSLDLWRKNKEEFYMKYVAPIRAEKIPQTQPMAIGSAFDARVKSHIVERLCKFKNIDVDPRYKYETLFEKQVELQNRELAEKDGLKAFEDYKNSGALCDLLAEIGITDYFPRFEFEVKGEIGGVPLLGRPDLYFRNALGAHVILDWKVNGFYGKSLTSPKKGYSLHRSHDGKNRKEHKNSTFITTFGISLNIGMNLEDIDPQWATQMATYAWLLGEPVGGDFICGMEQLCGPPPLGVASFRMRIGKTFQQMTVEAYQQCWKEVQSGMEGIVDTKMLDMIAKSTHNQPQWLKDCTRSY